MKKLIIYGILNAVASQAMSQSSASLMDNSGGNAGAQNTYAPTTLSNTSYDNRTGNASISNSSTLSLVIGAGQLGSSMMCVGPDSYPDSIGNVIGQGSALGFDTTYRIPVAKDPLTGRMRYASYYQIIVNRGELKNPIEVTINGVKIILYQGIYFQERSWLSSDFDQKQIAVAGTANGKAGAVNGGSMSSSTTMQSRITSTGEPCWTNLALEQAKIGFTASQLSALIQRQALQVDLKQRQSEQAAREKLLNRDPRSLQTLTQRR